MLAYHEAQEHTDDAINSEAPLACFLASLVAKGIQLSVNQGRLRYRAPVGSVTPAIKAAIASRREEIMRCLIARSAAVRPPLARKSGRCVPSLAQEASWRALWRSNSEQGAQLSLVIPFDNATLPAVRHAVRTAVGRHDVLRYSFCQRGETLEVAVNDPETLEVEGEDITALGQEQGGGPVRQRVREFTATRLPIDGAWLLRVRVVLTDRTSGVIAMLIHHLIADGASLGIVRKEIVGLLVRDAVCALQPRPPSAALQFSDYAAWERNWFRGEAAEQLVSYWSRWIQSVPRLCLSNAANPLEWQPGYRVYYMLELDERISRCLRAASARLGYTPSLALLTSYSMALANWSQCRRFAVLSVSDIRAYPDYSALAGTVGPMTVLDPIDVSIQEDPPVEMLLGAIAASHVHSSLLRFPMNECQAGLREQEFHYKIAPVFNYFAPHAGNPAQRPISRGSQVSEMSSGIRCSDRLRKVRDREFTFPFAPIHLRVLYANARFALRLEFNEAVVSTDHQEALAEQVVRSAHDLIRKLEPR